MLRWSLLDIVSGISCLSLSGLSGCAAEKTGGVRAREGGSGSKGSPVTVSLQDDISPLIDKEAHRRRHDGAMIERLASQGVFQKEISSWREGEGESLLEREIRASKRTAARRGSA